MDEKRFDVDGAYNSYYEIIKKDLIKPVLNAVRKELLLPGKSSLCVSEWKTKKNIFNISTPFKSKTF